MPPLPTSPVDPKIMRYWPEIVAIAVFSLLLAALQVPVVFAAVLTVAGYGAMRWIAWSAARGSGTDAANFSYPAEPTLEELYGQMRQLQASPGIAAFARDLANLLATVRNGLLNLPRQSQDPALRELTRVTLSQAAEYTRQVAALPQPPGAGTPLDRNYRALLSQSARELQSSYSAATLKNNAALAEQIESSSQALQTLHQQMRTEDA